MTKKLPNTKRTLSVFFLAMINVAVILSIKNWPLSADYGFSSLTFYLLAAIVFFVPVSLVSAELATGWPERGGVFIWVKEALGHRMGFLAIWLLWIENVVWYPTILSFIAATIAYSFNPALANNTTYTLIVIFVAFWGATLANLLGMKMSGWISTLGVILGTILPGALIIILGIVWTVTGEPLQISLSWNTLMPDLTDASQLVFFTGVILGLAGMEMSGVHARDVINPQKNYPRAILLAGLIIIVLSILGTLAIAIVVPKSEISLVAGGMEAISYFLKRYNLDWSVPLVSILVAIGAFGGMSTWTAGPSKGLLAAAQSGDFPPILHKMNKRGMPVSMMIFQGIIVSILSLVFLFMPDVSSSFWILLVLTAQLYLFLYLILFASAIVLRYKKPHIERAYKIPGGKVGMWIVAGLGFLSCLFAMIIGFIPPSQLDTGNLFFYESFIIGGMIVLSVIPFIILLFKKPSWDIP